MTIPTIQNQLPLFQKMTILLVKIIPNNIVKTNKYINNNKYNNYKNTTSNYNEREYSIQDLIAYMPTTIGTYKSFYF